LPNKLAARPATIGNPFEVEIYGRQAADEVGEYVRGSLWVLPGTAVLVALIAGSVLSLVPVPRDWLLYKLLFQGTPDAARPLLIGTAGTMISVVAVVLGLTVVALQVASGQYSPRLLGNFLRDRDTQTTRESVCRDLRLQHGGALHSRHIRRQSRRGVSAARGHWRNPTALEDPFAAIQVQLQVYMLADAREVRFPIKDRFSNIRIGNPTAWRLT
jgi:hypothetical protein